MRAARSLNGFHNFDVSLASQYFKANALRVAAKQQVKSGIRDVEVFDGQLVKIGRKNRVRESNRSFRGANRDSQRCSEQQENASCRPGLRRTRDRIESRAGGISSLVKTAEKLRQTAELDVKTCFVQTTENLQCFKLMSVKGEPQRDQRVIVGPDRSVVIGHGIVTGFTGSHGANPARKHSLA